MGIFNIRLLQNIKQIEGRALSGHLKISEKSLTKPKGGGGSLIVSKKVETFCFRMLVQKLAHTHRFEHKTFGLKNKQLTTRSRTPELAG